METKVTYKVAAIIDAEMQSEDVSETIKAKNAKRIKAKANARAKKIALDYAAKGNLRISVVQVWTTFDAPELKESGYYAVSVDCYGTKLDLLKWKSGKRAKENYISVTEKYPELNK